MPRAYPLALLVCSGLLWLANPAAAAETATLRCDPPLPKAPQAAAAAVAPPAGAEAGPAGSGLRLPAEQGRGGLLPSTRLQALPRGELARQQPIFLQAQRLSSQLDVLTEAEGEVEFRRGALVIQADSLRYDQAQDLAAAKGRVRVSREGAVYTGPELSLRVQRMTGEFLQPRYEFPALGTGGQAERIEFLGPARSRSDNASYTGCPREGPGEPDWVLQTRRVTLDLDTNVGVAEGAVLRFLGTPILALPTLSFPLNQARKSGWLPPSINIDNRSGIELSVPYYWNIAPNRDATVAPRVITRRGLGLDAEFRYLEPGYEGVAAVDWLPQDRVAGRSRLGLDWLHEGRLGRGEPDRQLRYRIDAVRVSDADWWKDFPNDSRSFTTRLLPLRLELERRFAAAGGDGLLYARAARWQVLQVPESRMLAPYQRSPQLGVELAGARGGWEWALQAEYNRFTLPSDAGADADPSLLRADGQRVHLLGALSRPLREPGWWVVPRLAVNAARYEKTGLAFGTRHARVIPTFSIDAGLELERQTQAFGRTLHQTLEPRLLYVQTPFKDQAGLPNYDAAAKDFNFVSLYSDNAFSGVDRVSDAHQLTAGFTTRLVDAASGAEALRLGLVQRYLLRTQRITARPDGLPGGVPLEQRLSDALLLGSTSVFPGWTLDGALQYSPDISRTVRTVAGARWSPGPFRTVGVAYRLTRGASEQVELGWQWPLFGAPANPRALAAPRQGCKGAWYSVGRVNYSMQDSRVTDSVLGAEYDAGCWIMRLVATRLSTGRSEATTRLGIQLELTGFSKLNVGSNPLKVLKDNIPGYQLLREERTSAFPVAH